MQKLLLLIFALIALTTTASAQSDCGDCGQCVVVFRQCTGGQNCCGLTNTILCHYIVSSEFCGEWQYFECGGQPFPQCQGGIAEGKENHAKTILARVRANRARQHTS